MQGQASGTSPAKSVSEDVVREELNRVLASHEFRASKRSQDFLRFIVEQTLTGHTEMLKERTIGVEVFDKPASYDPSDDATVRVKAGEVRKRLGLYYAENSARSAVRIDLPLGSYVPEFRLEDVPAPKSAECRSHGPRARDLQAADSGRSRRPRGCDRRSRLVAASPVFGYRAG